MTRTTNPPTGEHRIVFRHRGKTVEVFDGSDGKWSVSVQGDAKPSGPFDTSGQAVEAGITGAEHKARRNASRKRAKGKKRNSKDTINAYIRGLSK